MTRVRRCSGLHYTRGSCVGRRTLIKWAIAALLSIVYRSFESVEEWENEKGEGREVNVQRAMARRNEIPPSLRGVAKTQGMQRRDEDGEDDG